MKRPFVLSLAFVVILINANAQKTLVPSDSLRIWGEIEKAITYDLEDLLKIKPTPLPDQIIANHNGEIKDTLTDLAGIGIQHLLEPIVYRNEKPKYLNEFYFVFEATDGYRVVFSWNELFNTDIGQQVFILTTIDGQPIQTLDQRIVVFSTADTNKGRRYVKCLQSIEVKRVGH